MIKLRTAFAACAMVSLSSFAVAAGSAPAPSICSRTCWTARAPSGSISQMGALTRAIVHHTAGNEFGSTGLEASKANVRGIQNEHMNNRGWADIGYHFLVDKHGNIFEGRSGSLSGLPRGAHDGDNTNSFGFNCMGFYHTPANNVPTAAMLDALYDVIAWRMPNGWQPYGSPGGYGNLGNSVGYVDGHRRVKATACPGDLLFNPYMGTNMNSGAIRAEIQKRMNGAPPPPPKHLDVFVRATDDSIRYKRYYNGTWAANYVNLGGPLASDPTAVSWGSGRVDVFARGTDNRLKHKWYDDGVWNTGWEDLPGGFDGSPAACSWGTGRIDLFGRNSSNQLIHKWYVSGTGWSNWENLGGTIVSDPTAVSWAAGRIDVFARGSNNALLHKWYETGSGWMPEGSWQNLGGTLTGGPDACSWGPDHLDVYSRWSDGTIWHRGYSGAGNWGSWEQVAGVSLADPTATTWGWLRVDVFYRAPSQELFQKYFDGAWNGPIVLGGALEGGADACTWNNPQ
jgi:hypothetical protein